MTEAIDCCNSCSDCVELAAGGMDRMKLEAGEWGVLPFACTVNTVCARCTKSLT
jgi:hypothetical protein